MAVDPNEKEDVGAGAPADGPKLNDMIVICDSRDVNPFPYPSPGSQALIKVFSSS